MMNVTKEPGAVPVRCWAAEPEPQAMAQLRNTARLPFVHPHGVCAMPDVHLGIGATVGSVVATRGAVVPAAVGVDIGCGMAAVRLAGASASDLPDSLAQLRSEIEHTVPTGFGRHRSGDEGGRAAVMHTDPAFRYALSAHPKMFARRC